MHDDLYYTPKKLLSLPEILPISCIANHLSESISDLLIVVLPICVNTTIN